MKKGLLQDLRDLVNRILNDEPLADEQPVVDPPVETPPAEIPPVVSEENNEPPTDPPVETLTAACGCKNKAANSHEGDQTMEKKARVQALIGLAGSPFEAQDEAMLLNCSDDRLAQFEVKYKTPEAPVVAQVSTDSIKEALKSLSVDEFLGIAPTEIREIVADQRATQAAEHGELVSQLKAAQDAYSEDELKEKPVAELRKLAKAMGAGLPQVDYSAIQTRPRVASAEKPQRAERPGSSFDRMSALMGDKQ
jgi:hypothetical protein